MKLQGNIPVSAQETANFISVTTDWQKRIAYDVLIEVAIKFHDAPLPSAGLLSLEPQQFDTHNIASEYFHADAKQFRLRFRTGNKRAEFFRRAMLHGAQVFELYAKGKLPEPIERAAFIEVVAGLLGRGNSFDAGIKAVEALGS